MASQESALASKTQPELCPASTADSACAFPQVATARFFKCPKCNGLIPASDTGHPDSVEDGGAGGGEHALAGKISDPLLQLFRQSGKVAAEHLEEALAVKTEQGGKLYEILIRLGHLKAEDLHALLSRQPGIAAVHLANIAMDRKTSSCFRVRSSCGTSRFPLTASAS